MSMNYLQDHNSMSEQHQPLDDVEDFEGAEGGKVGGGAATLKEEDAVGEGGSEGADGGAATDHDVVVVDLRGEGGGVIGESRVAQRTHGLD